MKHLIIIPLLFLMTMDARGMSLEAANALTQKAGSAYTNGDVTTALLLYDSVDTSYNSASLQVNLGNCHFRTGNVPRAILHYERALRLDPGADDALANLEFARQQLADRITELPGFAFGSTWGQIRGGRDVDHWARRALWACLALFLALGIGILLRRRGVKRVAYGAAGVFLLATVVSVAFASVRHAEVTDDSEAIIMVPKVDVRSEPSEAATVLFVLHKGTKVSVQQVRDEWSEVKLPNGSIGWMPPLTLERI